MKYIHKNFLVIGLIILSILLIASCSKSITDSKEEITFGTPELEQLIRGILNMSEGKITKSDLEYVKRIEVDYNSGISDISVLQYCVNLEYMYVLECEISDISPLSNLNKLKYLDINGNNITDLSPLKTVPNLEELILCDNPISSLEGLSESKNLWYLEAHRLHTLTNLNGLAGCTSLRELFISSKELEDISDMANLTDLTVFSAPLGKLTDISALSNLINLTWIDLTGNEIEDFSAIDPVGVRLLGIGWNNITNFSHLEKFVDLTSLIINGSNIDDLSILDNLTRLTDLHLGNNRIVDISLLEGMQSLRFLQLQENLIEDILPLVNNSGIGFGDYIILKGNPLNEISINTYIPQLEARGVDIRFE